MQNRKTIHSSPSIEHSWFLFVSDKGVSMSFSSDVVNALRVRTYKYLTKVAIPWMLILLGSAGIKTWLLPQPNSSVTPTEEAPLLKDTVEKELEE
ncbi:MAG: hypothetical protein AAF810_25420 [Cyanobacteria bacterium P01_D01_bin.36]